MNTQSIFMPYPMACILVGPFPPPGVFVTDSAHTSAFVTLEAVENVAHKPHIHTVNRPNAFSDVY